MYMTVYDLDLHIFHYAGSPQNQELETKYKTAYEITQTLYDRLFLEWFSILPRKRRIGQQNGSILLSL